MSRVVLMPSSYPPSLGGVEEMCRHLALALVEAGDAVEVWVPTAEDTDAPFTVELDGITVRRFPMPLPSSEAGALARFPVASTRSLLHLRRAVAAFGPDLLHVHCFGPNGIYATAVATLQRLPLVLTLHGETVMDDTDIFTRSSVMRTGIRWGLRRARVVTGCSAFTLADSQDRFGLDPAKSVVVPNGVDLSAGPDPVPAWAGAPDRPYVLCLGRVVEKKGFDLLLAAYAGIPETERTADLVVGGEGAQLASLRREADRLGLADRVHFPGRLSRQDVAAAMAGAELFVMPSRLEPFGIVVLEAWRAGVPVVATSIGGPPEFVRQDVDGVLVDPADTAAFTAVLRDLLADPDRRGRLGGAGADRVTEFAWPVVAARYRELYAAAVRS
jgi:glycosyltransferase involved in cell wall biosynthesis